MPETSKEWKMPKNIRQIGDGGGNRKIYVEDYVITFLERLSTEDKHKKAVLLGEVREQELYPYIFVSGAVEADNFSVDDAQRQELQEKMEQYFSGKCVVGWFMTAEESPVSATQEMTDIFQREFPGENQILIVRDIQEEETMIFMMEEEKPAVQPGYYIYYDKNPAMQNYMVVLNEGKSVEKEAPVKDDAIKRFRKIIKEKKKIPQIPVPGKGRLAYFAGGFLVVTVMALGVTMVYNYDKMKEVERSLARLTNNVDSQRSYLEEDAAPVMLHMENGVNVQSEASGEKQTVETLEPDAGKTTEAGTEQMDKENSTGLSDAETAQTMQKAAQAEPQTEQQTETEPDAPASAVARASYTVKAGDTLAGISEMYYGNLEKVAEICTLNGIDDENTILPGQKILLP